MVASCVAVATRFARGTDATGHKSAPTLVAKRVAARVDGHAPPCRGRGKTRGRALEKKRHQRGHALRMALVVRKGRAHVGFLLVALDQEGGEDERQGAQMVEPGAVGDGDDEVHFHGTRLGRGRGDRGA